MGFRVRRSFSLAPGVRLNLSKSGFSTSLGARGCSVNIGRRGVSSSLGIPGTGLSSRTYHGGGSNRSSSGASYSLVRMSISITDEGELVFSRADGIPLTPSQITAVKRQHGPEIRTLIEEKCAEINSYVEALSEIHFFTPSPNEKPVFQERPYPEPEPALPIPKKLGLLGSLFKSVRARIEEKNRLSHAEYEKALETWKKGRKQFQNDENKRREMIETGIYSDPEAMQRFFETSLMEICWPRETSVSVELLELGKMIYIDVDLPEIEDMPQKTASAPQRGYKLSVKSISESALRKMYASHVHGVGFRLIGEAFASLPLLEEVVLSAYSQRRDQATGRKVDEYLYSVKVDRGDWSKIDFSQLMSVDASEALSKFEIRRNMTKSGVFKSIDPFSPRSRIENGIEEKDDA